MNNIRDDHSVLIFNSKQQKHKNDINIIAGDINIGILADCNEYVSYINKYTGIRRSKIIYWPYLHEISRHASNTCHIWKHYHRSFPNNFASKNIPIVTIYN